MIGPLETPRGSASHPKSSGIQLPPDWKRTASRTKKISAERTRKTAARELVEALTDAAIEIGQQGVINDFSRYQFHLKAKHIAALLPPSHEKYEEIKVHASQRPDARVVVPWPPRAAASNELRSNPWLIIGLLMQNVLDGEAQFFREIADAVATAKRMSRSAVGHKRQALAKAGEVALVMECHYTEEPDWFQKVPQPMRAFKIPYAVYELCKEIHNRGEIPTRDAIRIRLKERGLRDSNLSVTLKRLRLEWVK